MKIKIRDAYKLSWENYKKKQRNDYQYGGGGRQGSDCEGVPAGFCDASNILFPEYM